MAAAEEQARLLPALSRLGEAGYEVSVDTWSADTARRCLDAGARMLNFTGGDLDDDLSW